MESTPQQNSSINTTNFFRGGIYPSLEDALIAILQNKPQLTQNKNQRKDIPNTKLDSYFMKKNFPDFFL